MKKHEGLVIWIWRGYLVGLSVVLVMLWVDDWRTTNPYLANLNLTYIALIIGCCCVSVARQAATAPVINQVIRWCCVLMLHTMLLIQMWP
ncbi:hypothetical protein ACFODZ_09580 [Marinicella sediminis]|uniref:Uncharacterized protein n=1 Tax=Marinicella sediminis TaxID=1792834 RepID=A0ABV7JCN2_9GAMM|nr:hypothetical protein [Marinicella sediminis]